MKHVNKIAFAAIAMAAALCLAACGDSTNSANANEAKGVTPIIESVPEELPAGGATSPQPSASAAQQATATITMQQAMDAALADAGLAADQVSIINQKQDRDDGVLEYDIDFMYEDTKYEYEIDAYDGSIKKASREPVGNASAVDETGLVGLEAAKQTALSHAGLGEEEVVFTELKLDKDDGITEYNVEFYHNGTEYEYEINAASGEIIEYDMEKQ